MNTEHPGISYGYLLDLLQKQGYKCALSGLSMSDEPGDPMAMTVNKKNCSGEYVEGNIQIVCQWVHNARGSMSNNEFRLVLLAVRDDGRFLRCDYDLDPDSVDNAFLCLVRDALFDEFWLSMDLTISSDDGRLDISSGDWWLIRVDGDEDEGMIMKCRWLSGHGRPAGWPDDDVWMPVDIGDPGSVGKIVEFVRVGLEIVRDG